MWHAATIRALGGSVPVDVFDEDAPHEDASFDDDDSADDAEWDAMEV